jgi:hypothetical protein
MNQRELGIFAGLAVVFLLSAVVGMIFGWVFV